MIYGRLKNTEYIITNCTDIKLSLKNYNTLEIVMPRLLTTIKIIKQVDLRKAIIYTCILFLSYYLFSFEIPTFVVLLELFYYTKLNFAFLAEFKNLSG